MYDIYISIKKNISNNTKVLENYFFMTSLQVLSSIIGIILYPYLITKLGVSSYGLYVFALSITSYFISFVSFGFNLPSVKSIVINKDNHIEKSKIVSSVFTTKLYFTLFSSIIFFFLILFTPSLKKDYIIYIICYSQIVAEFLIPGWYFQGLQKMQYITIIQLSFRLLTIPFIFLFIHSTSDLWIFVLISSLSTILSGIALHLVITNIEKIKIKIMPLNILREHIKEALPFFLSNTAGIIKQDSIPIIIGIFFSMREVAIYDLANKIIVLPRMLTTSINGALFPKIMDNFNKITIKKVIAYEALLGLLIFISIVIFGRWIVIFLGGTEMIESYPIAIILSVSILVWLVVGCYINFIFVPQKLYYYVTKNQLVALLSFFICCIISYFTFKSIISIALSLTISGLFEIAFCYLTIRKLKLL